MGPRCFPQLFLTLIALIGANIASGQTAFNGHCQVTSTPLQVRAEGVTERVGDIDLECSGPAGAVLAGNLIIYLPVNVTNRIDENGFAAAASLLVNSGSGFTPSLTRGLVSGNSVAFNGFNFTAPSGNLTLRLTGIRAAASQFGAAAARQPMMASISSSLPINQAQVIVAYRQTGLTTTLYNTGITCVGSPAPGTLSMTGLFEAGTAFASTRLTEGFSSAFDPRQSGIANGTRFLIKYSGLPSAAKVYVPEVIAGSDALTATAGGDLGGMQSAGRYLPGSNVLVLVRVNGADATGAGGFAVYPPDNAGLLDGVSEVALTAGAGYVVYEVAAADPAVQESAQFPTFISLPRLTAAATASETVSLAPVSSTPAASSTAPVVRFTALPAPSDCSTIGDCDAAYFPKLMVDTSPIRIGALEKGGPMTTTTGYITVRNGGGGLLAWNVSITYQNGGTGWLFVDYASGVGNGSVRVWSDTRNLSAGTYQATITVNGGGAGTQTVPVTLTVVALPPPPPPAVVSPAISQVLNPATFAVTPLVAGSLATVTGTHFSGRTVSAAFDGIAATVLYSSDTQINLQVPAGLASKTSANLVLTVDGVASSPAAVTLAPAWPSIFARGVLNQDNSINGSAAAAPGDVLQIFGTGMPSGVTLTARVGSQTGIVPLYAGDAPTVPGVQQVNIALPGTAASGDTLVLCATAGGRDYCSDPYPLSVR